jgi:hypothetical protein
MPSLVAADSRAFCRLPEWRCVTLILMEYFPYRHCEGLAARPTKGRGKADADLEITFIALFLRRCLQGSDLYLSTTEMRHPHETNLTS